MNTENFALSASSSCCCASSFLYDTFLQQIFNFISQKQFFFVVMGYSGLLLENSKDKPETEKTWRETLLTHDINGPFAKMIYIH